MEELQLKIERFTLPPKIRRRKLELSDLPECVLLEILYKLPIKLVFKFKTVSKYWLSLISQPLTAQSYNSHNIINNSEWTILYRYRQLLVTPQDMWLNVVEWTHPIFKSPSFTLRFFSDHLKSSDHKFKCRHDDGEVPVIVLAVSNGLLLSTVTPSWQDSYYVSNPLTTQWFALPKPPRVHEWVSIGFIAEPITGSFQVVRIGGYEGSVNVINLEIFSSKIGEWKNKMVIFDFPVQIFISQHMSAHCHPMPCKSTLYWMEYEKRIIAYETGDEKEDSCNEEETLICCRLLDLPGDQDDKGINSVIGVCQDQLHYCEISHLWSGNPKLHLWVLRKSSNEQGKGDQWSLLYGITYQELNIFIPAMVQVVAFHTRNPDIVYLVQHRKGIMSKVNLRTKVCKDIVALKNVIDSTTVFAFVLPAWPTPIPCIERF